MTDPNVTRFRIEFVDADPQQADPALVGQAARAAIDDLRAAGYDVYPAYIGTLGGAEIYELLRTLADGAQANKDVVLALITSVAAPIAAALAERLKQSAKPAPPAMPAAQPSVIVIVGGTQTTVRDPQITGDELLRQLLAVDANLAERVTPQTDVVIRATIPSQPQHKRR